MTPAQPTPSVVRLVRAAARLYEALRGEPARRVRLGRRDWDEFESWARRTGVLLVDDPWGPDMGESARFEGLVVGRSANLPAGVVVEP